MSTLMNLVDLTRGALQADQAALNATANNVANQNTVGYTDEVVSWTAGDTVTLSGNTQAPEAPTVTTTSLRDRVLDQRVQQQTQAQSGTAAEAAVLSQMEGVFSITGNSTSAGSTQLGTSLNAFFSSLTALAANPSDEPTQRGVLGAAQTLAEAFNAAASGLAGVQTSLNSDVSASVAQVNSLTKSIAALNGQIQTNDPSQDAGQLEDTRQEDITKLSALVGLNQTNTESNGLTLTTTGGTVLVAGQQSYGLSSAQVGGSTVLYDDTGANITAGVSGGSIGGQLTAQGVDLPAASTALDQLAYQIGTAVNAQNIAGQTSAGVAGCRDLQGSCKRRRRGGGVVGDSGGCRRDCDGRLGRRFDRQYERKCPCKPADHCGGCGRHDDAEPGRAAVGHWFELGDIAGREHDAAGVADAVDHAAGHGVGREPGHGGVESDALPALVPGGFAGVHDCRSAFSVGDQYGD